MRSVDLTGRRFGRLVAESFHDRQNKHRRWLCRCDCGKTALVKGIHLTRGTQVSCGCLNREQCIARSTTHGLSRVGGKWTPEYATWRRMKDRCTNPKNHKFYRYGGRGIRIAAEWHDDYPAFLSHIGPKPSIRHSVDRINNDGHYEPGNVRWALPHVQSLNQGVKGIFLDVDDNPLSMKEIAHHLAMPRMSFFNAMRRSGVL